MWVCIGLSGALYTLAQPPSGVWFLGYVCLVPWLLWLNRSRGGCASSVMLRGAISGLVLGALAAILCGRWVPGTLRELGAPVSVSILLTGAVALWTKGVQFGLVGICLAWLSGRTTWVLVLGAALTFGAAEVVWSTSPWGAPWSLLGHSQGYNLGVAQLAALGGVPLVSAFVVLGNSLVASLVAGPSRARASLVAAMIGAVAALSYLGEPARRAFDGSDAGAPRFRVTVVQPQIFRGERWSERSQHTNLRHALALAEANHAEWGRGSLIVLPEMVVTTPLSSNGRLSEEVRDFAAKTGAGIILGAAREPKLGSRDGYRNSVLWFSREGTLLGAVDKEVAVPVIESGRRFSLLPGSDWFSSRIEGRRVEEGNQSHALGQGGEFAVAICNEVLFPGLVKSRASSRTLAILNPSDDSWTAGTPASEQYIAAARFRAIERGVPLLRPAIHGPSIAMDRYGRRVEELRPGDAGVLRFDLFDRPPLGPLSRVVPLVLSVLGATSAWFFSLLIARSVRMRVLSIWFAAALVVSVAPAARGEGLAATLTLDALSFVSFSDREILAIPAGSTIRFRFDAASESGSVSFEIRPGDVEIRPIPLQGGGALFYRLAAPTTGVVRREPDGDLSVEFAASIVVSLDDSSRADQKAIYSLRFTTGRAEARSRNGWDSVAIEGARMDPMARHLQLVGATVNAANAMIEPDSAVHSVLSGSFDVLPRIE